MNTNNYNEYDDSYINKIKEKRMKLQNEDWKNLKLYVKQFVEKNNISYTDFIKLIKNLNNDSIISHHQIYILKSDDNYLNINNPDHTANKLFNIISEFKNQFEINKEFKDEFLKRLNNIPLNDIYKNKIDEISHVFTDMGFDKFNFVEIDDEMY